MTRSFYAIIQYCPDAFRKETVNVGLILLQPEPFKLSVRITEDYNRVCRLFNLNELELMNLKISLDGMKHRIENSTEELNTEKGLANFAASRANSLRITKPRLAIVENFDVDFERLFIQLA